MLQGRSMHNSLAGLTVSCVFLPLIMRVGQVHYGLIPGCRAAKSLDLRKYSKINSISRSPAFDLNLPQNTRKINNNTFPSLFKKSPFATSVIIEISEIS